MIRMLEVLVLKDSQQGPQTMTMMPPQAAVVANLVLSTSGYPGEKGTNSVSAVKE